MINSLILPFIEKQYLKAIEYLTIKEIKKVTKLAKCPPMLMIDLSFLIHMVRDFDAICLR